MAIQQSARNRNGSQLGPNTPTALPTTNRLDRLAAMQNTNLRPPPQNPAQATAAARQPHAVFTPRLDDLNRMQGAQMGASATFMGAPSGAAQDYHRKAQAYNQADRLLRYQARRGNVDAALENIKLQDQATKAGFHTGGIRKAGEFQTDTLGYEKTLAGTAQGNVDVLNEAAAASGVPQPGMAAGEIAPAGGAPETRTTAALDILEGNLADQSEDGINYARGGLVSPQSGILQRGLASAGRLGVTGQQTAGLLSRGAANPQLQYNQVLDQALSRATNPQEVEDLRARAYRTGMTPAAFARRADWWKRNIA